MSDLFSSKKTASLKVHEWLAVAILIGVIGGLAIITSSAQSYEVNKISLNEGIEIFVKGAVGYPGVYRLPFPMKMKDILEMAQTKPESDLRKFNLEMSVKRGRVINVPTRAMITIHIKGAVKQSEAIMVPKGTRIEELISSLTLDPKADLEFLRKKRKLKANETIDVPFLKT